MILKVIISLVLGAVMVAAVPASASNHPAHRASAATPTIICSDFPAGGTGSAYTNHTFTLADMTEGTTDLLWTFWLKDTEGNYKGVYASKGTSFTIPQASMYQDYQITDGALSARVECRYTAGGNTLNAEPFEVSLSLKPAILGIDNLTALDNGDNNFKATFTVRFEGSNLVEVEVEEEYNKIVRYYSFQGSGTANVTTGNITSLYYSWIYIKVRNTYGEARQTLTYNPNTQAFEGYLGIDPIESPNAECGRAITLFNATGVQVFSGTAEQLVGQRLTPGIYIKKETVNGKVKTSKLLIR